MRYAHSSRVNDSGRVRTIVERNAVQPAIASSGSKGRRTTVVPRDELNSNIRTAANLRLRQPPDQFEAASRAPAWTRSGNEPSKVLGEHAVRRRAAWDRIHQLEQPILALSARSVNGSRTITSLQSGACRKPDSQRGKRMPFCSTSP